MTGAWRMDDVPAIPWLSRFPESSVDLVIADPPYESLNRHRNRGTTARCKEWFPTMPNSDYSLLASQCRRVLKSTGAILLFGDATTQFSIAYPAMISAGWTLHSNHTTQHFKLIAWDKRNMGMGYGFREQLELIILWRMSSNGPQGSADRSVRNFFMNDREDCSQAMRVTSLRGKNSNGQSYYPTEKPVHGLLDVFVRQLSPPGGLVIDPFAGSGSSGEAALKEGRSFLGTDINPPAIERSRQRLENLFGPATAKTPRGQMELIR